MYIAIILFLSDDNFDLSYDLVLNYQLMHFFSFGMMTVFIYLGINLDRLARVGLTLMITCVLGLIHEQAKRLFGNEALGFEVAKVDYWLVDCLGGIIFVILMVIIDSLFFERIDSDVQEYD